MKRILSAVISLLILISLISCSANNENKATSEKTEDNTRLTIVATLFPQYSMAKEIVGDLADVTMLLPAGIESHDFDPTFSDIRTLSEADLVLYTGESMETWMSAVTDSLGSEFKSKLFDVSCGIPLMYSDDAHNNVDPHIWTSPENAVLMAYNVCEAIIAKDPSNTHIYRENYEIFSTKLLDLHNQLCEASQNSDKTLWFGGEFAFRYAVMDYQLKYRTVYDSCNEYSEPSAKELEKMIADMKECEASIIFYADLSETKTAQTIANETGCRLVPLYSCHNLSKEQFENSTTFLDLMTENVKNISEALS